MTFTVRLSEEAEWDIFEITRYVAQNDSLEKGYNLVDQIMEKCISLAVEPQRGHIPPEFSILSIKSHLQIHFKPYRIIYRIDGRTVWIDCVIDGRRDLDDLLQRRFIR